MSASSSPRTAKQVEKLMSDYLGVCNKAIAENQHKRWLKAGKRVNQALLGGKNFQAIVLGENSSEVLGDFAVHFAANDDEQPLSLLPDGDHDTVFSWRAPLAYLEDVAHGRPEWYIAHPMRLDWSWLKHRAGQTARRVDARWFVTGLVLGAVATALVMQTRQKQRRYGLYLQR